MRAVIKPGEQIPTAIRKRLGAELKKLAGDGFDFDLVCTATRQVLDAKKTPGALPLIVMELLNGKPRPIRADTQEIAGYGGEIR